MQGEEGRPDGTEEARMGRLGRTGSGARCAASDRFGRARIATDGSGAVGEPNTVVVAVVESAAGVEPQHVTIGEPQLVAELREPGARFAHIATVDGIAQDSGRS